MKEYTIRRGEHYSKMIPTFWIGQDRWVVHGQFTESCVYDLHSNDQQDWNKLWGISYGLDHHKHSLRWAWRWSVERGLFELAPYVYIKGERRMYDPVATVGIGEPFRVSIFDQGEWATFYFRDTDAASVKKPDWFPFGVKLNPYFGGQNSSPRKMTILLDW